MYVDMYGMCSTEQFVSYLKILHELHYLVCVCMLMIYFCTNCIISPDSGGHVMVLMVFTLPVEIFTLVFIWAELPWSIAGPTQADINILEKQTHKNWTELNYQPD